jgi:hypothetical protein
VDPHRSKSTTATTVPPAVSAPSDVSTHGATYQVAPSFYTLSLSATTAECWVEATNTATGAVLFTATLSPGQSHSLVVIGPATVIAGAPDAFAAKINRSPVTLPIGPQGPFTLNFQTAPAA